ncbi:MAG: B12-binding domain-containing radical SAM protein, partial [Atribacterota bacterium]
SVEKYRQLIGNFHRHRIMIVGSFVFGFDDDDPSVFPDTMKFIEETKIDFGMFNILTPLPGTQVFEKFKNENRIFSYDWSHYDFTHVVYHPAKMTAEELQRGNNEMYRKFYTMPNILKRTLRNWRYTGYYFPSSLYYNWVSRHPHSIDEK